MFVSVDEKDCEASTREVSKVLVRDDGCVILMVGTCKGETDLFYCVSVFDSRNNGCRSGYKTQSIDKLLHL